MVDTGTMGAQILGVLLGLFMLYFTYLNFKRRELKKNEFLFWFLLWIVFILVALFPTIFDFIALGTLNFARRMDFFIILGFMFLIGLTYKLYGQSKENKKRIERLVREISFRKVKK